METAEIRELISAFVPEEILRDFELKEVKKESGVYRLYMDEKDDESHYPPELTEAKEVVRYGYMNPCEIQTFPIAGCETGQSKITDAYRLPCKKVIHTVGPLLHGGSKGEGRLLASCYDTALELANSNRLHRIAFPCISTGVYRFPKAEAARIALHSIFAFAMACLWMYRQYVDWSEPGFDHNATMTIIKALQKSQILILVTDFPVQCCILA